MRRHCDDRDRVWERVDRVRHVQLRRRAVEEADEVISKLVRGDVRLGNGVGDQMEWLVKMKAPMQDVSIGKIVPSIITCKAELWLYFNTYPPGRSCNSNGLLFAAVPFLGRSTSLCGEHQTVDKLCTCEQSNVLLEVCLSKRIQGIPSPSPRWTKLYPWHVEAGLELSGGLLCIPGICASKVLGLVYRPLPTHNTTFTCSKPIGVSPGEWKQVRNLYH